ncbi:MAG: 3'-5' exonuclease, partial [Ignavibacteria bacterium]|nr:3'-5' exonuclease [Ignavibacteria bacterium]
MNLVFDIETVGCEIDELTESQQEFLLRQSEHEADPIKKELLFADAKRYLSLYPLTAKVISIGLLDVVSEKVIVLFEAGRDTQWVNE